ncbi:radical SAM protein [candidate division WOR-3 bacterium]|nr:radical SAM protein [candidate division WOR-3 bacterium]MCK4576712.1 radical SAM protein [candidate division WOR-3 bacterium]
MANVLKKIFKRAKPLKKGVYHYRSGGTLEGHRVHLRIESNGSGLLIIDADKILYLNQTAAEIIKGFLDGKSNDEIVKVMIERYRVRKDTVSEDLESIKHTVKRFAEATDIDPVTYLSNKDLSMFTTGFSSPHRMDILLTYDNSDIFRSFCFKHPDEVVTINLEQWKRVIEILWNVGVPHILFSGGEPTSFEGFIDLVQFAEEVGIVTGLLTNGEKLADMNYTNSLVEAGLDHLQVTLESHRKEVHNKLVGEGTWEKSVKGLENALATPLYCVAHTTFTKKNMDDIPELISFLKEKGVYAFAGIALKEKMAIKEKGLSLTESEIKDVIKVLARETEKKGITFVWYGEEIVEGEAKTSGVWEYSMCIEPNGDVTPCEYEYKSFGNIQKDEWKDIWSKAIKYNRGK